MSLESEIEKIVENCGARLYDIELLTERGRNIYRVTITHPEGVDLDMCADISNMISPLLDVQPPIKGEYSLEVSSPGIERKLKKPKHFQSSIGEEIRLALNDSTEYEGVLAEADESGFCIETGSQRHCFGYDEIAWAKTFYRW